ncbi:MAG: hypothetical protein ACTHMS_13195 [Jatrophihabitans sp.]|uniref:hypothetical protein n=1 Tax=Jatrophihabitans sp. TaxID=1932789 RepID=UPI003F7EA7D9
MNVIRIAKDLWAREPVIVSTVIPELASVGVLSAHQADAVSGTITAAVALAAQGVALVGAFVARSKVKSPATQTKEDLVAGVLAQRHQDPIAALDPAPEPAAAG